MDPVMTNDASSDSAGRGESSPRTLAFGWRFLIAAAVVFAGLGLAVGGVAAEEVGGACLYRSYCVSCHGASGHGDGSDAAIFAPPPPDLRKGFLRRYEAEELVERVRTGDPRHLTLDPEALRAQATEVESLVSYLQRLPSVNWRAADAGQAIFLCRCTDCHGRRGKPGTSMPPGVRRPRDLSDQFLGSLDDAALIRLARHGRKGMPALLPRVSEEDGRSVVAFVRLFSPGYDLYSRYCANCHGDDGRGRSSVGEVLNTPAVTFDQSYFRHTDPERLRTSVWHMVAQHKPTMPHYRAELSAAQARAIITYLKQSE
jgi:mono/diheme cytochrome c family protein